MSDKRIVYAEDAIEAVHNLYAIFGSEGEWVDRKDVFEAIDSLPSAQPEDIARDIATIIENEKDMRVVLKNAEPQWIPVSERLPEETDSIFARYYGTERWSNSMFRKRSKEVIVTTRFKDGTLHTETAHTNDGKWWFDIKGIQRDVIAWCEMPEPWRGEKDG